jgi:hypothetical protein
MEIAVLSENPTAVEVATKQTVFHSDFEDGNLEPEQIGHGLGLSGVADDAVRVVSNPEKDSVNDSDFVMLTSTVPSAAEDHTRAEYTTEWTSQFATNRKKHIFQWMVYFPEDYLVDIDEIRGAGGWHLITQFVTDPCARYPRTEEFKQFSDGRICYGGGIFNEARINSNDHDEFVFKYRASPDCNQLGYTYPRGEWVKFTYEIFWTTESDGHYAIWANERLIGQAEDVQTLPTGFVDGTCDLRWKVGLYDSWTDSERDSVYYYIDNLEMYIDKDIETVCSGCRKSLLAGDVDGSGEVDLRDAMISLKVIAGMQLDEKIFSGFEIEVDEIGMEEALIALKKSAGGTP